MLPELDPRTLALPPSENPYQTSWDEIRKIFVEEAPKAHRKQREHLLDLLLQHAEEVVSRIPDRTATLWIDGGFLTHKDWAEPSDIDVVYFVPRSCFGLLASQEGFWTKRLSQTQRFRPMMGKVDAYCVVDSEESRARWIETFTSYRGKDDRLDPDVRKGFVEVKHDVAD